MDRFEIHGPATLAGRVEIAGAKNAALPALAAVLLSEEPVRLAALPGVADIRTMSKLLAQMGVAVESRERSVEFAARTLTSGQAPYELVKTMRASVLVLGPLLARHGTARVSLPGGCAIGSRPVNLHISALQQMGAAIRVDHGDIVGVVPSRLHGADITFETVTVTGTENVMMAATLAKGTTILRNAAAEPEVVDLAEMLRAMGARITGDGTTTIEIEGVDRLSGCFHTILPDRIEAGTYVVAGALAGSRVEVAHCRPDDLSPLTDKLRACGVPLEVREDSIVVSKPDRLLAADLVTEPHPGFPTDLQAQYMTLMTQAEGSSRIEERIFENRFQHALELARMGADIRIDHHTAIVRGGLPLTGTNVMASDLRASAALVLAGLVADNTTTVHRIYHLDRGYERMEAKLTSLGANLTRVG